MILCKSDHSMIEKNHLDAIYLSNFYTSYHFYSILTKMLQAYITTLAV